MQTLQNPQTTVSSFCSSLDFGFSGIHVRLRFGTRIIFQHRLRLWPCSMSRCLRLEDTQTCDEFGLSGVAAVFRPGPTSWIHIRYLPVLTQNLLEQICEGELPLILRSTQVDTIMTMLRARCQDVTALPKHVFSDVFKAGHSTGCLRNVAETRLSPTTGPLAAVPQDIPAHLVSPTQPKLRTSKSRLHAPK